MTGCSATCTPFEIVVDGSSNACSCVWVSIGPSCSSSSSSSLASSPGLLNVIPPEASFLRLPSPLSVDSPPTMFCEPGVVAAGFPAPLRFCLFARFLAVLASALSTRCFWRASKASASSSYKLIAGAVEYNFTRSSNQNS
jgi:hypothetical protein